MVMSVRARGNKCRDLKNLHHANTIFVDIIRGVLLKGNNLVELLPQFLAFAAFSMIFTFNSIFRLRKTLS